MKCVNKDRDERGDDVVCIFSAFDDASVLIYTVCEILRCSKQLL